MQYWRGGKQTTKESPQPPSPLHTVSCNKKTLLLLRYLLVGIELIVLLDHAFAVIYAAHLTTN